MTDAPEGMFAPLRQTPMNGHAKPEESFAYVGAASDDRPPLPSPRSAERWEYHDATGNVIMTIDRHDDLQGKKHFSPLTLWRDAAGRQSWRSKHSPVPRPLYGLDRLAQSASFPVLVVEGEKAADAAGRLFLDHTVTTSPGGANAAEKANWAALAGREVVIWPDQDAPGLKYAIAVSQLARAAGALTVRIVKVPASWPRGWDLADPLPLGVKGETLRAMIQAAAVATATTAPGEPMPVSRCLADVPPVPLTWLWQERLALGKANLIAGQPGLGKSQITALLAAHVTTGRPWPDGTPCPVGSVIMITCEDDAADTIVPRLCAAGGDCRRAHILDWVAEPDEDGKPRTRSFVIGEKHTAVLRLLADRIGDVRLIVIDPVSAYMGSSDSHKASDVRASLAPLQALAADIGACIVLVSHLNKGTADGAAISRVAGSGAFVAACRSAWFVAPHPEDQHRRIFTPLKNNIGDDKTGFAYRIEGVDVGDGIHTSRVVIDPTPIQISAEDALGVGRASDGDNDGALGEAVEFLRTEVGEDGRRAADLKKAATTAGISWRTVERAKKRAGIEVRKEGFAGGWRWFPVVPKAAKNTQDRQGRQLRRDGNLGGLGDAKSKTAEDRQEITSQTLGGIGGLGDNLADFDDIVEGVL